MNKRFSLVCVVLFFQTAMYADTIKVTNKTPKVIYVAVYEESKDKDGNEVRSLYNNKVYTLKSDEKAAVERPNWSVIKRAKPGNNRNLYFDFGDQGKQRLQDGYPAANDFVNIGNKQGDSFVIYPGYSDGDKFTPALLGQELKGTTQKDYDKNIKNEIE